MSDRTGATGPLKKTWHCSWSEEGILIGHALVASGTKAAGEFLDGFITQLMDDGYAVEANDEVVLKWNDFYEAVRVAAYAALPQLIGTPPQTKARMSLRSRNTLIDPEFLISVSAWRDESGPQFIPQLIGPVMAHDGLVELMRPE